VFARATVPNLKQISLIHRLTPNSFMILFNVALPTTPVAPKRSLYVSLPLAYYKPRPFHTF
jgi:hypothetical protein